MPLPLSLPGILGDPHQVIAVVTDHAQRAKDRLAEQFKNQPNLAKVLDTLNDQTQKLEDALWQLLTERTMSSALGAQLDALGRIVGQARQGFDDETYRLYLKARVLLNVSSGTKEEIYSIFRPLVDVSTTMRIEEQPPAAFVLRFGGVAFTPAQIQRLIVFLRAAKSAGVRAIMEWFEYDPAEVFTLDIGPGLDQGHLAGGTE